jgi:hypothetical protein
MMRRLYYLAAIAGFSCWAANASPIVLTFEGLANEQSVDNYYNGGLAGDGTGPGPSYGITFTDNALSIISDQDGGSGSFADAPSGDTIVFFLSGAAATMNVPAGFSTGFSFFYSAINVGGTINVWSGLNDTGTLLTTLTLPTTSSGGPGCGNDAYCPFDPFGVSFSGTAESVDFGGAENQIGFDNITLGSSTPGGGVPEPGSLMLLGTCALGLGLRSLKGKAA